MKKLYYPAIFTKEDKGYSVQYLDFEIGYTFGETLEEAYYMAQDVLYAILDEYDELPNPTLDYMNIKIEEDESVKKEYYFITIVELDLQLHKKRISKKSVNTTVTMPEWLKETAEANNINFSEIIQKGIKEKLGIDKHL